MRTRIKGLMAVVIASAAIGGALAAPASADPPILELTYSCTSGGLPRGPATFVSTPGPVHQCLGTSVRTFATRGRWSTRSRSGSRTVLA
jgi:hypothetical protein